MKEIKIIHLFPRLLSLYGEYGNVAVVKSALETMGYGVTVKDCEDGCLEEGDFYYVGSGTEDNLMVALERLTPCAQQVRQSIAAGKVWLATGNAMALFGKTLTRGRAFSGIGAFDYSAVIDDSKRFLGDALTGEQTPSLGFINTSCIYTGIRSPLLKLRLNPRLGNDKTSPDEGIRQDNFLGTQLIGPFLAKNPHYLGQILSLLTGERWQPDPDSYMAKAYAVSLAELTKRAEQVNE